MTMPTDTQNGGHQQQNGTITKTSLARENTVQDENSIGPKPAPLTVIPENIPAELKEIPRWCLWRYEPNSKGNDWTKVPYHVNGRNALPNDPATFVSFDAVLSAFQSGQWDGIGFLTGAGIAGVDVDDCRDPETGDLTPAARNLIATLDTYTEVSPSGTGIRCFAFGTLPPDGRKRGKFEMYDAKHYLTVTGQRLEDAPLTVEHRQEELAAVHAEYIAAPPEAPRKPSSRPNGANISLTDEAVLAAARRSKSGPEFTRLYDEADWSGYPSQSEADQALTSRLAWWTNFDLDQTDRLFRASALMRDKWDEKRGNATYGELTLARAFKDKQRGDGYQGQRVNSGPVVFPAPPDLALLEQPHDDLGYAHSIALQHYPALRYSTSLGPLVFDPEQGRHVSGPAALALFHEKAILTQRSIVASAQQIDDEKERRQWEAYAKTLRSRSKREAALELMSRTRAFVNDDELDRDALEINTPDGVLDLRTLEVKPHDPSRVYTSVTRARYRPGAAHWAVDAVLGLLHRDNRAEYVQRALGQALTGRNNREMFIFVGPKATGKTTLGEGLLSALGRDYGVTVDPRTLLAASRDPDGNSPRADLVSLRTARLVLTSEPPRRSRLDGDTVKRMTGGDTITARAPYAPAPISFRSRFTVVMLANEEPGVDWQDDALLSRLQSVPFEARPAKADPRIRAALVDDPEQEALDALFTWAAQGAQAWIRDGYSMGDVPEAVQRTTRAYRVQNDPFATWADERLDFTATGTTTPSKDLHADYRRWADNEGIPKPESSVALGRWLSQQRDAGAKIEQTRNMHGSGWRGVRLKGPTG